MAWLLPKHDDRDSAAENSAAKGASGARDDAARDEITSTFDKPPTNMDGPDGVELLERKADETSADVPDGRTYRTYKRRWFGLAQLVLLNIVVSWDVCAHHSAETEIGRDGN